jgi:protein-tyrosine phosphatase
MAAILFVCLGNICRSPAAEGITKHLAKKHNLKDLHVESCGIGDWYTGKLPDARMRQAAQSRGLVLQSRAKPFDPGFFAGFDYILAADRDVLHQLYSLSSSPEHKAKIHLITDFSQSYRGEEIPDPYYGGEAGFETVLDMLEESCESLLRSIYRDVF